MNINENNNESHNCFSNNMNVESTLYTNFTANHHVSQSNMKIYNNNNNNNDHHQQQRQGEEERRREQNNDSFHSYYPIQTDTNILINGVQQISMSNNYENTKQEQNKWIIKPLFNPYRIRNKNLQNIYLPQYQSRHNKMLSILYEYETLPLYLVSGFIRELGIEQIDDIIIPMDLINLCFKFYQHQNMANLIDSKDCDELYCLAWEATEKEDYLFAEQLVAYLLKYKTNLKNKTKQFGINKQSNNNNNNGNNSNIKKNIGRCSASEDASTANLMAVIKYFMKDYKSSEQYFVMATSIDPSCDIILNNYAVLLLEQERYIDAEREIIRAIRCNPTGIKNHQQYAFILFTMGKYQLAAKECQLMILLEPNVESYSGYAWLLEQMGQFHESVLQYEELINLEPDNAIWYFWYAVLLQRCQQYNSSRKNFKKCLDIDPNYEGANGAYAYSLYLNGEYHEALKYIKIAMDNDINNDKDHLCVHYYYALIMIKLKNIQTAVNELYQCLDLIQLQQQNKCKNEKGCLLIDEYHIYNLLTQLGYN